MHAKQVLNMTVCVFVLEAGGFLFLIIGKYLSIRDKQRLRQQQKQSDKTAKQTKRERNKVKEQS